MELESQPRGNDSFSSHLLNQVENISSPNQKYLCMANDVWDDKISIIIISDMYPSF